MEIDDVMYKNGQSFLYHTIYPLVSHFSPVTQRSKSTTKMPSYSYRCHLVTVSDTKSIVDTNPSVNYDPRFRVATNYRVCDWLLKDTVYPICDKRNIVIF